jgi:hypothetical protein
MQPESIHKLFIGWFKSYRAEGNPLWRSPLDFTGAIA